MKQPTHYSICRDCRKKHGQRPKSPQHLLDAHADWGEKHKGHRTALVPAHPHWYEFADNSDVKEAFQAEQTMAVTALQSLGSSATAGWNSNFVDNSANLYLDAHVMLHFAAVNTAPSSDQSIYVFAYGSTDGSIFTSTGTSGGTVGTEGTLTFPSISTLAQNMPLIGIIPYPVQNKALDSGPFSVAAAFGGILPVAWGIAILNFSGMTFAAAGNTVKYRGVYNTVI